MGVSLKACCCGCSLRTGVTILAILGLIGSAYFIYQGVHSIKVYKELEENPDKLSQNLPYSRKHFQAIVRLNNASLAFRVISLLVDLLLLGSCSTGDTRLAFPWLGWSIFELFFTLGEIIFYISIANVFVVFLVIYSLGWLLSIYFIVVVYSFIEALRGDPSGTSAGFSPPLRRGNQTQMAAMGPPPYAASLKGTV